MKLLDIVTSPWCIMPEKLLEIKAIYETHLRGEKIDIEGIEARTGKELKNKPQRYDIYDNVVVVPISGVIAKKMNLFSSISGGASSELIGRDFKEVLENDSVKSIILNIDSPGGAVDGTPELANLIYSARGKKNIVAITNGEMASGAYWIGAATEALYITSNVDIIGSIGVVATHVDVSRAEERVGVKTTEITAGKYKRIASGYSPLSEEGRKDIQEKVDYIYSVFVNDIAKFRGVSVDTVLEKMADGKIFIGNQAKDAGLVDGVSTLDRLIADLQAAGDNAVILKF